jgi:hypothetical protein
VACARPRPRLGGIGTPASDALAYAPTFLYGLPAVWISQWQVKYYGGIAVDIHGNPTGQLYPTDTAAIDPNDPPAFESQRAYLKRLGFLLTGEARRTKKADFEPEAVYEVITTPTAT